MIKIYHSHTNKVMRQNVGGSMRVCKK